MTVSRYLFVSRAVCSGRAATGAFAEVREAESRPRGRNVIAEFFHAHAVAAHDEMHQRIGENIDEDRLPTGFEPLPRDVREIRTPLPAHNCTPEK